MVQIRRYLSTKDNDNGVGIPLKESIYNSDIRTIKFCFKGVIVNIKNHPLYFFNPSCSHLSGIGSATPYRDILAVLHSASA